MKQRKPRVYADFDVLCEICGRRFKTPQGLSGHRQIVHTSAGAPGPTKEAPDAADPSSVASEAGASGALSGGSAGPSIKQLRGEIDELKLLVEKRKLQAELPNAEPPDLMQQLGLGPFDPAVRAVVQRRAVNAPEHEPQQSWLDKLLSSPDGVRVAVDGLKGVLGVGRESSGDNLSTLLKDLGFNLKDLLLERAAPKGDAGLTIGGVSLDGASLTPELLKSVLEFRSVEEKARLDGERDKLMVDSLGDAINKLAPVLADLVASRQGGPGIQRRPGAGPELEDPQPAVECPKCGRQIPIPAGFAGGVLRCTTKLADTAGGGTCMGSIDVELIEQPEASTPGRKKRQRKPEPPAELKCRCGQLIDISGRGIGDTIRCPVCQEELQLTSETESLPAEEPLTDQEKQDRAFRDKKGGL